METTPTVQRVTTPAGDPAWLVTGYANVRALLTDPRLGRSHPEPERAARVTESVLFGRPQGTPATERADHGQMRRLLSPAFSARRMATLQGRVQALLDGLLDDMSRLAPPVNLHETLSFPLPALVICELLGVPFEDRDEFRRWSDDAGDTTDEARSRDGLSRLFAYMQDLVERKRRAPAEDVISDLIAARERDPGAFEDETVPMLAAGLLFAGHETTVAAIDRGVVLLLTNPDQRVALQRDPALVAPAVEEILRHPRVLEGDRGPTGMPRYPKVDIEVDGVTIPAWDLVLLSLDAANRDVDVFVEPEAFEVTRAENPHVAFGHGPRFCLGAPLARIELQAVFGTLFRRFPTLRLAVTVEELRPRSGKLTGGLTDLPVTW
jgi:cytochrome P450